MKKIYSLLLLGAFMLLGAQSAWSDNFLKGSWDGWSTHNFNTTDGVGEVTISGLSAYTSYDFCLLDGSDNITNDGIISCSVNRWEFSKKSGSCKLYTGSSGNYKFKLEWIDSKPMVSVTYPDGNTLYIVYFERSTWNGSTNSYAHVWNEDNSTITNLFGDFPGIQMWGNLYFETDKDPQYVIFSNGPVDWGNHHQTSTLPFYNGTTYDESGIKPYTLTINSYGWASMYLTFPAKVPTGATAYYAESRSGSAIVLKPIEANEIIPANTGVVVKGTASANYTFAYDDGEPVSVASNLLKGVFQATSAAVNSTYVLATGDENSCTFKKYTNAGNDGEVTLGANKAYILVSDVSSSAPAIRFEFEEENNATDIKSVKANEKAVKFINNGKLLIMREGVVYDATGRVVR